MSPPPKPNDVRHLASVTYTEEQLNLADLLLSIKILPLESLIMAALHTLKDQASSKSRNKEQVNRSYLCSFG